MKAKRWEIEGALSGLLQAFPSIVEEWLDEDGWPEGAVRPAWESSEDVLNFLKNGGKPDLSSIPEDEVREFFTDLVSLAEMLENADTVGTEQWVAVRYAKAVLSDFVGWLGQGEGP